MIAKIDDAADGAGVQIVADEDADLVAPHLAGGALAPADVRVVDYVVVQQGGRVDEFHYAAEDPMFVALIAAESCGEN